MLPSSISSLRVCARSRGVSAPVRGVGRVWSSANRGIGSFFHGDSAIGFAFDSAGSMLGLRYFRLRERRVREDSRRSVSSLGSRIGHASRNLESSWIRSRKKRRRRVDECSYPFADKER